MKVSFTVVVWSLPCSSFQLNLYSRFLPISEAFRPEISCVAVEVPVE